MSILVRTLVLPFVDFIYPPMCICCERRLRDTQRHVCTSCWNSLERVDFTGGLSLTHERLFGKDGAVTSCLSCFYFKEGISMQRIIHSLKYQNRRSLGIELGRILGRLLSENPEFLSAQIVIPVPLHRTKLRERGYNQCDFISRGACEATGQTVRTGLLLRRKNTISQTELSLEERRENVRDAFLVAEGCRDRVRGARILLIDDVITTGATLIC